MLKNIILEQKRQKEELLTFSYVPRNKEDYAKRWLDTSLIKVILGPRRAGKSIFSLLLLKDRPFMYFNFDDEALSTVGNIATDELMKELHSIYGEVKTIMFDEIQNLPNWELFVNRLHRAGYNLILTGSNAYLLSQELATHLTGRHIPIEILPFDFMEYSKAKKIDITGEYVDLPSQRGHILNLLEEYLVRGGFPDISVSGVGLNGYLDVLFDSLLFKDVVKRHRVRFSNQIATLAGHLINNFASLYTIRKLMDILNLKSTSTTEKYIKYLEEAYLIFSLTRYSPKSAERIRSPRKLYAVDNGFITAKAIQHSPNTGKLMENLIFLELIKRGLTINKDLFYYKTRNSREVDFVVKSGHIVTELIQVCYDITNPDTEKREIKALLEAAEELNIQKLTLITWGEKKEYKKPKAKASAKEPGVKENTIVQIVPLLEWLTTTKS